MKSLSASVVVFSGSACLVAGAFIRHGDTATFVMLTGGAVALCGMWGWFRTMRGAELLE